MPYAPVSPSATTHPGMRIAHEAGLVVALEAHEVEDPERSSLHAQVFVVGSRTDDDQLKFGNAAARAWR